MQWMKLWATLCQALWVDSLWGKHFSIVGGWKLFFCWIDGRCTFFLGRLLSWTTTTVIDFCWMHVLWLARFYGTESEPFNRKTSISTPARTRRESSSSNSRSYTSTGLDNLLFACPVPLAASPGPTASHPGRQPGMTTTTTTRTLAGEGQSKAVEQLTQVSGCR